MEITHENFMQELNNCVSEQLMVTEELKKIKTDTPDTHDYILQLNGRAIMAMTPLPDIIKFIAEEKPDPKIVGNKLKQAIELTGLILREKTRILKNTPAIYRTTNDKTGPN